ncbi:MAG TPA: hypothetical protein VF006_26710 [Longimicrobium sp.]
MLGGLSVVLFGLIAATGRRVRVDFSNSRNLVTAAVTLTIGAGDLVIEMGGFSVGGIGTATFGAIILIPAAARAGGAPRRTRNGGFGGGCRDGAGRGAALSSRAPITGAHG